MRDRRPQHPERVEQYHIGRYLSALGAKVYTIGTTRRRGDHQGTMQTPGLPDLIAFVPNRKSGIVTLLVVECKAEGGRLSEAQREFRGQCERAGVAHVVGGLDEVIAWLLEQGIVEPRHVPHYRLPTAATET